MALTKAQLLTRARTLAADPHNGFFTDDRLTEWLNDAQEEWAEQTKCLWRYFTTTSVESQQEYAPPGGFFPCTIYKVTFNSGTGGDKPLSPLRWFDEVYDYSTTWNTTEGLPQYYYIRENLIGLVPIPSSDYAGKTIRAEGYRQPSTIDDSTSPNIDDEYHKYLPYYVAAQMAAIDGRTDLQVRYERYFYGNMGRVKALYVNPQPENRLRQVNSIAIK